MRDLIIYHSSSTGHGFPIDSVEDVADQLQDRYEPGRSALTEHLIPELQHRGIFHRDHRHETLRQSPGT